jgi:quinol monooxygenase YgiN
MATVRTACTMTLERKDLDEVVGIFETFIKDVKEKDDGVIAYHYFIDEDEDPLVIHVIEWYESPQAMLDHYAKLNLEAAGRLVQLVELSPLHYYGNPTPEEEAQMAGFGTVLVHRPLASIEETPAPA